MTSTLKSAARRTADLAPLVLVVCLAQFMVILDVSIVNVALPSIRSGLHFSPTGLQWVVNAYTITFAGFLLLGGRAADLLGRRRVFLVGTAAFAICSLACALADSRGAADRRARAPGPRRRGALAGDAGDHHHLSPRARERNAGARARGPPSVASARRRARCSADCSPRLFVAGDLRHQRPDRSARPSSLGLKLIPAGGARDWTQNVISTSTGAVLATAGLATLAFGIVRTEALGWASPGCWCRSPRPC